MAHDIVHYKSGAELIDEFVRTTKEGRRDPYLSSLTRILPSIKRISFDHSICSLMNVLESLSPEEVIANLSSSCFPAFDKFWCVGPDLSIFPETSNDSLSLTSVDAISKKDDFLYSKFGALIETNPEKLEFIFQYVPIIWEDPDAYQRHFLTEKELKEGKSVKPPQSEMRRFWQKNNYFMIGDASPKIRVSAKDGIVFDEESLVSNLTKRQEREEQGNLLVKGDISAAIDGHYERACLLAGMLVVLGNDRFPNSFRNISEDTELERKNRDRRRMGRPLKLPEAPITYDLSHINQQSLKTAEEVRQFFGWTSVRRSNKIFSKYGKIFSQTASEDTNLPSSYYNSELINNIPPLFLNDIFRRFARIRVYKNDMLVHTLNRQTSNTLPYKSIATGKATSSATALSADRLLISTENLLRTAMPYQFNADAASSILDEEFEISSDITLPHSVTWIDNCPGLTGRMTSGALLADDGKGEISVTLFVENPSDQVSNLVESPDFSAQPKALQSLRNKLNILGERQEVLSIGTSIVFNREKNTFSFLETNGTQPALTETSGGIPLVYYDWPIPENYNELHLLAAKKYLQLAQALANNDSRITINAIPQPKPADDRMRIGRGRAPTRKASVVLLNLDYVPETSSMPSSNNPPLFLNEIFRSLAKIYAYKNRAPGNRRPYVKGLGEKGFASPDEIFQMDRILKPIETNLISATPYQIHEDAASILAEKELKTVGEIILPSPVTWIDFQELKNTEHLYVGGGLLVDDGKGKVLITIIGTNPQDNLSDHAKSLGMSLNTGTASTLTPLFNAMSALGENNECIMIVPNIVFDKDNNTLSYRNAESILPVFMEGVGGLPIVGNYTGWLEGHDEEYIKGFKESFLLTASNCLRSAHAISIKDPRITIDIAPKSKPSDDQAIIKSGRTIRRKASVVTVNPDFVPSPIEAQLGEGVEATTAEQLDVSLPPSEPTAAANTSNSGISLADFVIESGQHASGPWRDEIRSIGRELISDSKHGRYGAVRFVLDEKAERLVEGLYFDDPEIKVPFYKFVRMPFDKMWIETSISRKEEFIGRVGNLIKKSASGFTLQHVFEKQVPESSRSDMQRAGAHVRNDIAIYADGLEVVFSEKTAVTTLNRKESAKFLPALYKINGIALEALAFGNSQFVSILLLLISSPNAESNIWDYQNNPNIHTLDSTKPLPLSIKVSGEIEKALDAQDYKTVKKLLGWTDETIDANGPPLTDSPAADISVPPDNDESSGEVLPPGAAWTEEGIQFPRPFESVVVTEASTTNPQSPQQETASAPVVETLTELEELEREINRIDALEETTARLLADAQMYLMQAQNRGFNHFDCRIVLTKPGFPILLHFSMGVDFEGEKRIRTRDFTLQRYDQAFTARNLTLTMSDALDLKVRVQSEIYNADGIVPLHKMSATGRHTIGLDTQMPWPIIGDYKVIQQSGGMYTLTYDAKNPYKNETITSFIPLGIAAINQDDEEKLELNERVSVVIDYLNKKSTEQSKYGHRFVILKRDVLDMLQTYLREHNKEWVTSDQKKLDGYEKSQLFCVSSKGNQKITLGPITLRMDVGGANPSWHCTFNFYIGDKRKQPIGKAVRSRTLHLHTRDFALAQARAKEALFGAKTPSGDQRVHGLLIRLRDHMQSTDDEWRVERTEIKGQTYEEVLIGERLLQNFIDDTRDFAYDIGVALKNTRTLESGDTEITIQAMRSRIANVELPLPVVPEPVYETIGNRRLPIAYTFTVPASRSHIIAEFVQAANEQVEEFAAEHYAPVALGVEGKRDRRKGVKQYRTSRIAFTVIRAAEALFERKFHSKLSKNWHGRDELHKLKAKPRRRRSPNKNAPG